MIPALTRVNSDLRRAALGVGGVSGSTVVALAIRGREWGVSWSGHSRAYVYRSGSLTQLTRDHTVALEPPGSLTDLVVGGDEITRAVGGDDVLELESASGLVADRDRFLLCSDGCTARSASPGWLITCNKARPRRPAGRWWRPHAPPELSTM